MRNFREPTAKNLLREPLVFGVPFVVLVGLTLLTLVGLTIFGDTSSGGLWVTVTVATIYLAARVIQHFAKPGWAESLVYVFERKALLKLVNQTTKAERSSEKVDISAVDTLEADDLIALKLPLQEDLALLKSGQRATYTIQKSERGFRGSRHVTRDTKEHAAAGVALFYELKAKPYIYSLFALPSVTTPLWVYEQVAKIKTDFTGVVAFQGVSAHKAKDRIETARRRNARISRVSNVESDVAFAEATQVLEGLARGDDSVLEASLLVFSNQELDLDPRHFYREKKTELPTLAIVGVRGRFHRSHTIRAVTASDLILNVGDPEEDGSSPILKTPRGLPLYFNPRDGRLEALHWLVTAASGAGKSFFVGLVLYRLVRSQNAISVLFVDHNRSFRRVTRGACLGEYLEPKTFVELGSKLPGLVETLGRVGTIAGVELSDLAFEEKRNAVRLLLAEVEKWLRSRDTIHPVYLVLDECWNFMRDEPLLVQRAFREFRKLNGAAIAITQSLSDFLMDESGRAIFQNAPIRILLRQAEDLEPYRGVLGLNDVELKKLRALRQNKGEFSECLVKTPFLSRIGRLHPTHEEHELLRTDNIREELVRESVSARQLHNPGRQARC